MEQDLVVRAQRLEGSWTVLGSEDARGIVPEDVEVAANQNGVDTITLTLQRAPDAAWPDLLAYTPIEVEVLGRVIAEGFIAKTPTDSAQRRITVQAKGWQYALDDVPEQRWYVHTALADFKDTRSMLGETLGADKAAAVGQVSTDTGVSLSFPNGQAVATNGFVCISLDLGPNSASWPRQLVLDYQTSGNSSTDAWVVQTADTPYCYLASGHDILNNAAISASASGTLNLAPPTPRRYVQVYLYSQSTKTETADVWVKLTRVVAASSTSYIASSASSLKAHQVVQAAAAGTPGITTILASGASFEPGRVAQTSFAIPGFGSDQSRSPRETIDAVNAYHGYRWRVVRGQALEFGPFPAAPLYEVGAGSGATFQNTSANDADNIYESCEVQASQADGTPLSLVASQTGTLVDRRGRLRRKVLPIQSPIDATAAAQLAAIFLGQHRSTPLQGPLTITGDDAVTRVLGGSGVHPSELVTATGELVRFSEMIDPDSGGKARDGRIASAKYTHSTRTCELQIDDQHDNLAVLLQRYGVLQSGGQ